MTIDIIAEFKNDTISREAGERLRNRIVDILKIHPQVEIDFQNKMIASTSFFDEGLAKLADLSWDEKMFYEKIKIKNMNPMDLQVLEHVCKYRGLFK